MIATSKNIKPVSLTDKILGSLIEGVGSTHICETPFSVHLEVRQGGYSELISECKECGATVVEK